MTTAFRRLLLSLALSVLACSGLAQSLPSGTPESLGFSPERLKRIDAVMRRQVDEQRIAGAVALVARHGKIVHLEAYGKADIEKNIAMTPRTIFRIASMTKAVTSVAVMMLVEEGALVLADPVSKYIPAFKQTFVAVPGPTPAEGARVGTVPAKRPITIRDLLTHTAGISYGNGSPAEAEYQAADVIGWYFADKDETIAQAVDRLAALPFDAQPGEKFVYGFATDILGRVVEVVSGLPLDEFLRTRIFVPLRMTDTHFFLPAEKSGRLAAVYSADAAGRIDRAPDPGRGQGDYVTGPRRCFSGGAGLVSTAGDYARFLQMLLNAGALDGARLLAPATVALMTANHVGALFSEGTLGFGLGFEVIEDLGRAGRFGSVGTFGWGGAYHTQFWVDPEADIVAVLMTQLLPAGGSTLQSRFRALVYQSIVDTGAPSDTHRPVPASRASGRVGTPQPH